MKIDEKIVEKIEKLLSLATSSNEHEARLAAEKANEFLVKHNISMQQVTDARYQYEKDVLSEKNEMGVEDKFVVPIITEHFFAKCVKSRNRRLKKTTIYIMGDKTNVAIARYVYSFLLRSFRDCWLEYKRTSEASEKSKQPYYLGLQKGLFLQLEAKRKQVEESMALVVVEDPGLRKFMRLHFPRVRTSSSKVGYDPEAEGAGLERGRTLHIRRGIDSKSSESGRYLK